MDLERIKEACWKSGPGLAPWIIPAWVLEELYLNQQMSSDEIGRMIGCSRKTIRMKLARYGIPVRSLREAFRVSRTHGGWNAGRKAPIKRSTGYVMIYAPDHPDAPKSGYIMEHRLVMERIMGRRLSRHEEVHHINEVRDDNRPENLVVMTKSEHMSLHAKQKTGGGRPGFQKRKSA